MTQRLTTLPNGFRIVSERMEGFKSASVGVWVSAGGRHERADQNGIAHFLEHMAFKGTARRSTLQIAEEIENVGGYINAYTSKEVTAYYARVLGQDVALALDVIADILLNPAFAPAEIEVERGVILQEIGQSLDTPDDVVFDWLQEVTYPDQPMGRTILGPPDRVRAFGAEDFRAFVGAHYGPDRLILSAAGEVDHDTLVADATRLFGGMTPRAASVVEPAQFRGGERREIRDLEQAHFAMSLRAPGYMDDMVHAAQVYAVAMGGGMSSRLFQEIREKRGLCYSIGMSANPASDTGALTIYAGTSGTDIATLPGIAMDELRRSADGLETAEIDRARAQLKAGLLMGLESASARAERMARQLAIWGRVIPLDETVAQIDAVDRDALRDFAQSLCANAQMALAVYGPVGDAPGVQQLRAQLAA